MVLTTGKRKREAEVDREDGGANTANEEVEQRIGHESFDTPRVLAELQSNASSEYSSSVTSTGESETVAGEEEDEETSSSGSSDEDDDSLGDSESVGIVGRTTISSESSKAVSQPQTLPDIRSRLSKLLPQLQQANAELHSGPEKLLDSVPDAEATYIEMDLGLGVLKEVNAFPNTDIKTAAEEESSSHDSSSEHEPDAIQKMLKRGEVGIPGIEEVDSG